MACGHPSPAFGDRSPRGDAERTGGEVQFRTALGLLFRAIRFPRLRQDCPENAIQMLTAHTRKRKWEYGQRSCPIEPGLPTTPQQAVASCKWRDEMTLYPPTPSP